MCVCEWYSVVYQYFTNIVVVSDAVLFWNAWVAQMRQSYYTLLQIYADTYIDIASGASSSDSVNIFDKCVIVIKVSVFGSTKLRLKFDSFMQMQLIV